MAKQECRSIPSIIYDENFYHSPLPLTTLRQDDRQQFDVPGSAYSPPSVEVTTYILPNLVGSEISKDLYFFDNHPFTD